MHYRMTLYAPRSQDPAEATPLSPRAGSAHSDVFRVATLPGLAGWQPYMDAPRGRSGRMDPLEKKTDTGALVVPILDRRLGEGNAERWASAFLGDEVGAQLLQGRRAQLEASRDGGATWAVYFTGRVSGIRRRGKLWYELEVRDLADDLDVDVFVGAPHASATYAQAAQLLPLGVLRPYADLEPVQPMRGVVDDTAALVGGRWAASFKLRVDPEHGDRRRTLITKALVDAQDKPDQHRLYMRTPGSSGAWQVYAFDRLSVGLFGFTSPKNVHGLVLPASDATANKGVTPTDGTAWEFYVAAAQPKPSKATPLLIGDVHPVTLLRHLALGYFATDASGNPRWALEVGSSFAALEADATFPTVRFQITEPAKLNEWVEEQLCQPFHLAYYLDAQGVLQVVDLRRKSTLAPAATLVDADLVEAQDELAWELGEALTSVRVKFYGERPLEDAELPKPFSERPSAQGWPDVPTVGLVEDTYTLELADFGPRAVDVKRRSLEVDARGLRFYDSTEGEQDYQGELPRRRAVEDYLAGFASDLKGPFSLGATYATLQCVHTANTDLVHPGAYVVLNLSALPDPATNQLGGQRLALCVERSEDGPAVRLRLLDAGHNSVCLPPTLGTMALDPDDSAHAVNLPVTPNAAGDDVEVWYAVTATSQATRPATDSAEWRYGAHVDGAGGLQVAVIEHLPARRRVWARARSVAKAGGSFQLPSSWVPFVTPQSVDTTGPSAPTGLTLTSTTSGVATVAFTPGDLGLYTEVYVAVGAAPSSWDGHRVLLLPPESNRCELEGLDGPAVLHTVAVRHVDLLGGDSAFTTGTVTTGAAAEACPRPAGLAIAT